MDLPQTFKAWVVRETGDHEFTMSIQDKNLDDLPDGDVLVKVLYSSLNFKDALSAAGNRGVTKNYPHTPGIDAAGVVAQSRASAFAPGDRVIVTSYDLGMNTPGGFGQYIRVPQSWVVPMPDGLDEKEAMAYGTAGFTAALCVWGLEKNGITPEKGPVLVSGASGGVGCLAVSLLKKLGHAVTAVNGRTDRSEFLKQIGADRIMEADEAADAKGRPMLKGKWAGVVDTVGGDILATAVKSALPYGVVTCCGNAASADLPLSVYPFILRGVTLMGADSQNCPMPLRKKIWEKLATAWKLENLSGLAVPAGFEEVGQKVAAMRGGRSPGRTLIRIAG